ncbi:MAG: NifU family protein [Bdellovibrionales bacterium]
MFIQTQATPNPATIKFIPGQVILANGLKDYQSLEEASDSPLAQRLFSLQGVRGVFLADEFVSVSKEDDTDWNMLKPMVMAALMEHLSTGQPIVIETDDHSDDGEEDDEITAQIKELIATRVRPMVMMDGGDIEFDRFDDGIVFLTMRGACAGCPSSTMTLKSGIESMLKHFVPEVVEVRPTEGF